MRKRKEKQTGAADLVIMELLNWEVYTSARVKY